MKGVAVGVAGAFFASVGFLLSVFAVVINPLLPARPVKHPPLETQQRFITHSPFMHGKPNAPRPDSGISSKLESDLASQTTSNTSLSSQCTSASRPPHVHTHSRSHSAGSAVHPQQQRYAHGHNTPLPRQSRDQMLPPPPIAQDYFSHDASWSPGVHVPVMHEVRAQPRRAQTTSSISSSPSPPPPQLIKPPAAPPVASSAAPTSIPSISAPMRAPPRSSSHDQPVDSPALRKSHSFRILSIKRSFTGLKNKASRSFTCPDPAFLQVPSPTPDLPRRSSAPSLKALCLKKREERLSRKASTITSEHKPPKSTSRRHKDRTNTDIPPMPPLPVHLQPPRSRTHPYEAPYFFPPPGSPDAIDYIRRAREEQTTTRPSVRHSTYVPLVQQQRAEENDWSRRLLRSDRGLASAPPTQVHFAA
ncbi:hypothetical protein PILCRDRAFT_813984 [Piloderma croceum F 1598]|uniref:Uncharacterized protein n=1 Tax=Piloderma croceum (strain F 1598) TaxID=765440 RepID=A0A0C3GB88_PILCF|nr:hypothetical protein PILCRDRAFT_813984 [Piloderma croceum F 1598]